MVLAILAIQVVVLVVAALALGWSPSVEPRAAGGGDGAGGRGVRRPGARRGRAAARRWWRWPRPTPSSWGLLLSGMVFPLDELPSGLRTVEALPSTALAEAVRKALTAGEGVPGWVWPVLLGWAIVGTVGAVTLFRWEPTDRTAAPPDLAGLPDACVDHRRHPDQHGRTVLVTGASDGLGLATSIALAAHGATVLLGCRSREKGERAQARVAEAATGPAPALVRLDLTDLESVRTTADTLNRSLARLDVLVNNAGIMAVPLAYTGDGFESQFATNHPRYALTGRLLPALLRAAAPGWSRCRRTPTAWHARGGTTPTARTPATAPGRLRALEAGQPAVHARAGPAGRGGGRAADLRGRPPGLRRHQPHRRQRLGHRAPPPRRRAGPGRQGARPEHRAGCAPQLYAATMPEVAPGDFFGPDGPGELRAARGGWA